MATMRREVWIDRSADAAWAVVGDPASMPTWFPGTTDVAVDGTSRVVTLRSGLPLQEEIVSVRADLRRFQYRLLGPLPVQFHLASIDVIPDGDARCVVVYSTDVEPSALAYILDGAIGDALETLKHVVEAA
jgi:hypothetical protein